MPRTKALPPDPTGENFRLAEEAGEAINLFGRNTRADWASRKSATLTDLITGLRHWADRNDVNFRAALERAIDLYQKQTR